MAFRDGPFENIKVPLAWTAAVVVVVAVIGAIVLLLGDRTTSEGGSTMGAARGGFEAAAGPVGGVFAAPVRWAGAARDYVGGYFFAIGENRRLKAEIAELRGWRDEAIAQKNINGRYEALLGLRTEPPVPMATGRAISESRGPFSNAKLIDVGSAKGVRIGNPVVTEHGLVGRVTGVTGGVSRVVLLTDVASRTPVMIERTDARAMLTGDGGDSPRLEFIRGSGSIKAGDRILSSGDGGGLPRGLPIGVAAKGVDGAWRVKLFSDHGAIDYVRVLLFQSFGQLVSPNALNAPPLAGLTTAPEPSAAEVGAIRDAAARRAAAQQAQAERARAAAAAATPALTPAPVAAPTAARPAVTSARPAASTPSPAPTAPSPAPAPAPGGAA
ncbi:rod shape-determining protein MreC [Brevundimonas sp. GW460-12-10-14-LB2]|uniref:rod shape-determining protein MreC n=1 Tax=Brevundimonas sp. GW460-12-10-14-LB2 TaxID=1827469 RepID=UPI0007BCC25B|nr:rod shape-determining protein MreC [Brevundimonas sp. GW460-12-10-14-LB2]ANC53021.1 rod shape-determining protein MreC [Brevundimonas sp. GW460-12-10-14-LB2]MEA3473090.1 rod shape-determining protein MreC [Pseudomonadota bacterium]